jgi:glutaredoxin 3
MPKVKVYSTPTCPWCKKTKEFLKQKKVEFEDINVAENHEAAHEMVEKSGQMGVPVTEIDGNIVVGFDKEKLESLLKK